MFPQKNTNLNELNLITNQVPIKMQGNHYPWGLYIGELRHPARGKLVPALIDNKGSTIFFEYNKLDVKSVARLTEDLVANFLLSTIDKQFPIINVLDLSLNNPFSKILQLNYGGNIIFKSSQEEFDSFNKSIKSLIRQRNTEVLDQQYTSIAIYNEQCDPRAQELYHINIINFNDYIINSQRLYDLDQILSVSEKCGLKFLFFIDKNELDDFLESISDEKYKINLENNIQKLLNQYPKISIIGDDIFLGNEKKDSIFHFMNELIEKNNLTLEISKDNFDVTLNGIDQLLTKLSETQDKPFLKIEVGVSPNGKVKRYFELGESNDAYHAFIVGMNGTGKTVFLDHIIKGIAQNNSPEEAELYLFDYKEGVEFKKYADLPHTKVLMLDNTKFDEIISAIQDFQGLLNTRGKLFRKSGVEKISEYNRLNPDNQLSRIYLVIDEVQEIFKNKATKHLEEQLIDVAKRGRAFGLHMIMSTQTLIGYTISAELLSQFAMRIAFKVNSSDASKIFMIGNEAPIYLKKRTCIINDNMGIAQANKETLVNKPISNEVIPEIVDKYPNFHHNPIIIESDEDINDLEDDKMDDFAESENCSKSTYQDDNTHTSFSNEENSFFDNDEPCKEQNEDIAQEQADFCFWNGYDANFDDEYENEELSKDDLDLLKDKDFFGAMNKRFSSEKNNGQ